MVNLRYLLIISTVFIVACQTSTSRKDPFDLSGFKTIEGTAIMAEADILYPQNIIAIDSGILIYDYQDPFFLQYYKNLNDTNPQYLAPKGSGPDEFINTRNIYYNPQTKKLFIYDSQLKRITTYSVSNNHIITDSIYTDKINISHVNGYETMPLKSDFITNGVFSGSPFARISHDGITVSDFGVFPVDSAEIVDPISSHLIFQSLIIANPKGTRMVSASPLCDWLAFYDMEGESPALVKEYYSYAPKARSIQSDVNTTSIVTDSESMNTYTCLSSTEDYMYALYDGRTQQEIDDNIFRPRYILKFNWDGELVDGFRVDERIYSFSVTYDDSRLIGLVYIGEDAGENNIVIKEYKLN